MRAESTLGCLACTLRIRCRQASSAPQCQLRSMALYAYWRPLAQPTSQPERCAEATATNTPIIAPHTHRGGEMKCQRSGGLKTQRGDRRQDGRTEAEVPRDTERRSKSA